MVKDIQWIYGRELVMSLPLNEGQGATLNNEFGVDGSIVGLDVNWSESELPAPQKSHIKFSEPSSLNYVYSPVAIDLIGSDGGVLEFEYFNEILGGQNIIICADGNNTSASDSVLYYLLASPTTLRFVNASGVTRTLNVSTNVADGALHKIKLQPEGSTGIRIFIDDQDEGVFGNMSLDPIHAFGGRQGSIVSGSDEWGVRNIKYEEAGQVLIDAPCDDGSARVITNLANPLEPLTISADSYPWELPPQPVPEILYSPDFNNSGYIKIPEWTPKNRSNWNIKYNLKLFSSPTSDMGLVTGDSSSGLMYCYLSASSLLVVDVGATTTVNGYPANSSPIDNEIDYKIVHTNTAGTDCKVTTIAGLGYTSGGSKLRGRIWDIELIDNEDPTNSRNYPVIERRPQGETGGTNMPCYDEQGNRLPHLDGALVNFPTGEEWVPAGDIPEPGPTRPILDKSPESLTTAVGMYARFESVFSGEGVTQKWYMGGDVIEGENESVLLLMCNSSMQGSQIQSKAFNAGGETQSEIATLTLRPRIYMDWGMTLNQLQARDKVNLQFNADGSIDYTSSLEIQWEQWCPSANDLALGFNMSDYEVRLQTSKGEAVVDASSDITFDAVTMFDGMKLVLDISAVPIDADRTFSVIVVDKTMPEFNWAGWNSEVLYYEKK